MRVMVINHHAHLLHANLYSADRIVSRIRLNTDLFQANVCLVGFINWCKNR